MGYYTSYYLAVHGVKSENEFNKLRDMLNTKQIIGYALCDASYCDYGEQNFESLEEVKWYSHHEDMKEIAAAFPDLTFCLSLMGETFDGCAEHYYHGKEDEICLAEIPPPKRIKW